VVKELTEQKRLGKRSGVRQSAWKEPEQNRMKVLGDLGIPLTGGKRFQSLRVGGGGGGVWGGGGVGGGR